MDIGNDDVIHPEDGSDGGDGSDGSDGGDGGDGSMEVMVKFLAVFAWMMFLNLKGG